LDTQKVFVCLEHAFKRLFTAHDFLSQGGYAREREQLGMEAYRTSAWVQFH
jgi:hypothetical protein